MLKPINYLRRHGVGPSASIVRSLKLRLTGVRATINNKIQGTIQEFGLRGVSALQCSAELTIDLSSADPGGIGMQNDPICMPRVTIAQALPTNRCHHA